MGSRERSGDYQKRPEQDGVRAKVEELIVHQQENIRSLVVADLVRRVLGEYFAGHGAVSHQTPILTRGMGEYSIPMARVIGSDDKTIGCLRHSPQFQKQMVTMATGRPYMQLAPSLRPGECDASHIPYLHQFDVEFPYHRGTTLPQEAADKVAEIIADGICALLAASGMKVALPEQITYDGAIAKYETDSPYIPPGKDGVRVIVVRDHPLFTQRQEHWDTYLLPMAQPDWTSETEDSFLGNSDTKIFRGVRVMSYDFVVATPKPYIVDGIPQGLEVGGGSVRIKDPIVQQKILKIVRASQLGSFDPLIALLEYFSGDDIYTAGGAVGTERLAMIAAGQNDIRNVVAFPFNSDGSIPL